MMKINALLLALALATPAFAQDTTKQEPVKTYNRAEYKAECTKQGETQGVDARVVRAVCECAVQYISHESNDGDLMGDFNVPASEPIVGMAVPTCIELGQIVGPDKFFEAFELTEVGARARE